MNVSAASDLRPAADRLVTMPEGLPKLTLGWEAMQWATKYVRQPNGPNAGKRWAFVESQLRFLLWWYAIDESGDWLYHHGARRLAKGSGKSPFAGVMSAIELLAPIRLDTFDSKLPGGVKGKPVSMPWVQIAATSESQTKNTMRMTRMILKKESRVAKDYKLDVGKTVIYTPEGGQLEVITSSAAAAEGAEITFCVADETEHWTPPRGGPDMAETLDRNLAKSNSRMLETCNAWEPGAGSVAQITYDAWVGQENGEASDETKILYDARRAPDDLNLADRAALSAALEFVYADCWWVNQKVIAGRIRDLRNPPDKSRRFYLNQAVASADAWLTPPEWAGALNLSKVVLPGEEIVLGFDGSRSRAEGIADATALIGCRLSDGHLFEIGVWQQQTGLAGKNWTAPVVEVEAAVRGAFKQYSVIGFYADPAKWETYIAKWEAEYGKNLRVKSSREHPIEWWMTGGRSGLIVLALKQFHTAVMTNELTHDGSAKLTEHVLNARRRMTRSGVQIWKEHPDSERKIDAAVAATLAWQARLDALARPAEETKPTYPARRIR